MPAVNVVDDLSLRAVVSAAEELDAPLIIQVSVKTLKSIGCDLLTVMFRRAAGATTIPVALHLDHCPERAVVDEVVAAGWSSVLFDASDRDLAAAEAETVEVVAQAHVAGVDVESEIENVIGVEDGVGSDEALHAYSVEELARVAERTGSRSTWPHSSARRMGCTRVLQSSFSTVPGPWQNGRILPIVLHGGTGLTQQDFASFIDAGVAKINISTALKHTYMKSAQESLQRSTETGRWDPPTLFRDIESAVRSMTIEHMGDPRRAAGRASMVKAG